jgi:hypothetical protein
MIEMLVHQDGPLVRRERAEEAVWVTGAAIRSGGHEPADQSEQSLSFYFQISLIFHDESLNRRRISPQGFVVSEYHWLDRPPDESPCQGSGRAPVPRSQLQTRGAVGHHLSHVHRAPLPMAIRSQSGDSPLDFFGRIRLKQILHGASSVSLTAALRIVRVTCEISPVWRARLRFPPGVTESRREVIRRSPVEPCGQRR